MKIHLHKYREEEGLPDNLGHLRPVLEDRKKRAEEMGITVPLSDLSNHDYEAVMPLLEGEASRLVSHPLAQDFSDIHVFVCGKKMPQMPQRSSNDFESAVGGTTLSGEMIALFLVKPNSQPVSKQAIEWGAFSSLPHEFYHALRMQSKAFKEPKSIGSTMVEEGLPEVFRMQEIACKSSVWAQNIAAHQFSRLNDQCMTVAKDLWSKLDETNFNYKEILFGTFPFYAFSLFLVDATLKEMGQSITDPEILYAPHSKILDLWRPERGGKLSFESLPKMISSGSIKRYLLGPQP